MDLTKEDLPMKRQLIKYLSIILSLFMAAGLVLPVHQVQAKSYGIDIKASDNDRSGKG